MKKTKKIKVIDKSMNFSELIGSFPETIEVLLEKGMHCIGCPMSAQESIEQGAIAHGLNPDKLIEELNKVIR